MSISVPKRILILDNDDCTGQYGILCILSKIYRYFYPSNTLDELAQFMVDHYLSPSTEDGSGGFRPYLKELLLVAKQLLSANKIDKLIIYTSATNRDNWVATLARCIEIYGEFEKGTIGFISRNEHFIPANDGAGIKDIEYCIKHFYGDDNLDISKCFMVDDKLYNIKQYQDVEFSNTNLYGVKPYKPFINPFRFLRQCPFWDIDVEKDIYNNSEPELRQKGIFVIMPKYIKDKTSLAISALTHDAREYPWPATPELCLDDNDLYGVITKIKIFYKL